MLWKLCDLKRSFWVTLCMLGLINCPIYGQVNRVNQLDISSLNMALDGYDGGELISHLDSNPAKLGALSLPEDYQSIGRVRRLIDGDPNIDNGGFRIVPNDEEALDELGDSLPGVAFRFESGLPVRYVAISPSSEYWADSQRLNDFKISISDTKRTKLYDSSIDGFDLLFIPGINDPASGMVKPAWFILDLKNTIEANTIILQDKIFEIQEVEFYADENATLESLQALRLDGYHGGILEGLVSPLTASIIDDSENKIPDTDIDSLTNGIADIDGGFESGEGGFLSLNFIEPQTIRYIALSPKNENWGGITSELSTYFSVLDSNQEALFHSWESGFQRFYVNGQNGASPSYIIFDLGSSLEASTIEISGDNLALQEIDAFSELPDLSLFSRPGLAFYEFNFLSNNTWPNMDNAFAINKGVVSSLTTDVHGSTDKYILKFQGRIWLPESGEYHFKLSPKRHVRLFIDGNIITGVEDGEDILYTVNLTSEMHDIEIQFRETGINAPFNAFIKKGQDDYTPLDEQVLLLPDNLDGGSTASNQLPIKVGIVYSPTTGLAYGDVFQYDQTYAACQLQSAVAGIPFELIHAEDLLDYSTIKQNYGSLLIPSIDGVSAEDAQTIADNLKKLMTEDGVGIVASTGLFSYDENGQFVQNQSAPLMDQIFKIQPINWGNGVPANVIIDEPAVGESVHPILRMYEESGDIVNYNRLYFTHYVASPNASIDVLAKIVTNNVEFNGVISGSRGVGKFVHFSSIEIMMDTRMVWAALRWAFSHDAEGSPFTLSPTRHDGVFLARNDMDLSRFHFSLNRTEVPLLEFLKDWKDKYSFVGSYYINNGDNPANGEFTDWSVSKPLYDQYIDLGNEIGTHSYTHPQRTGDLDAATLQFEFEQSKIEIEAGLGNTVYGTAIPGEDETPFVVNELKQYLDYISGHGFYSESNRVQNPSIGHLNPDDSLIYYSLNMTPDFVLGDVMSLTPEESIAFWKQELLSAVKGMPKGVVQFLWHDYAVTTAVETGKYSPAMIEETIKEAYLKNYEFLTLEDYMKRFGASRNNQLKYSWNDSDTLTIQLSGQGLGQYALEFSDNYRIGSVNNWYAYDDTTIFVPESGGTFEINLSSAPEQITRISKLPMRLNLQSTTGDGTKLEFSAFGEGAVEVTLNTAVHDKFQVLGSSKWEIVSKNLIRVHLQGLVQHQIQIFPTDNILPFVTDMQLDSNWNEDLTFELNTTDFDGSVETIQVNTSPVNGSIVFDGLQATYTPDADFFGTETISVIAVDDQGGLSAPGIIEINIQKTNVADGLANFNFMNRNVVIDGEFDEWDALEVAVIDPIDATATNDKLDFRNITLAHNDDKFFISYTSELPATPNWGHNIYIDIDANIGTGYQYWHVGGDILIQGGIFYQYLGSGTDWNWQQLPVIQFSSNSEITQFELAVDRTAFGDSQYCKLVFLADNFAYSGSTFDFAPDGFTEQAETIEYYFVDPNSNFPPSATPDSRVILADSSVDLMLTGVDRESANLSFQITTQPQNGTLIGTAPAVSYSPNPGFIGSDFFEFTVSDGELASQPARVDISIIEFPAGGIFSNDGSQIFLDGDLSEWQSLFPLPSDASEVQNSDSGIDWKNAYLAHDNASLFIAIENIHPITLNWGLMIFIDSDQNQETGFMLGAVPGHGFDIMVQAAGIFQYAGSGADWNWTSLGFTDRGVDENVMEFRVPTSAFQNLSASGVIDIVFYGDNAAFGNAAGLDLHPDAGSSFGSVWSYQLSEIAQQTNLEDQPVQIAENYNHTLSIYGRLPEALNPSLINDFNSEPLVFTLKILSEPRKVWELQKSENLKSWQSISSWIIYGNQSQTILPPEVFSDDPPYFFLKGVSQESKPNSNL